MKKIITLFLVGSVLIHSISTVKAQGGGASITANNLSPKVKAIVENVKTECQLNPNQTIKFTNDYVSFLNENAKPNAETQKLLLQAGARFRSYLNDGQFTKLTIMIQSGKLDPAGNSGGAPQKPVNTGGAQNQTPVTSTPTPTALPATVSVQSKATTIFEQLTPYMKVTPEQSVKAIPILKEYDKGVTAIKMANAGNDGKIQAELVPLNNQTIAKLKTVLNDDQLGKLILANTMQENILSGKNLSQDQKAFLDKLRNQYKLNDVQLMAVILVMVEGKIRGDAINQMAKTNPQGDAQELGKLLQDLDGRLKSALSAEQYAKVKSDIEKLIRGQKI